MAAATGRQSIKTSRPSLYCQLLEWHALVIRVSILGHDFVVDLFTMQLFHCLHKKYQVECSIAIVEIRM